MTSTRQRRFESVLPSEPGRVVLLEAGHPAMRDNRTIFPNTVVDAAAAPRLLVSGVNNRKIGRKVTRGAWSGMPIYTLTLEERASCPTSCHMLAACYGNAMQWARRIRHGEEFEVRLRHEVRKLAEEHPGGFVVRLHVLGDFYSTAYVDQWKGFLRDFRQLRIYGYTARRTDGPLADRGIAMAIAAMNATWPDRCVIRFSHIDPGHMRAVVIDRVPDGPRTEEGLVCPAERNDATCCASCGLCWADQMRGETIVFIRHGLGSSSAGALAARASKTDEHGMRQVGSLGVPIDPGTIKPTGGAQPTFIEVDPRDLWIDEAYQRSLSRKGINLILDLIRGWDWSKFKPPVICEAEQGGYFAIDGQHTAIAAASRPDIGTIPAQLIKADTVAARANSFLGHNRDRIAVTGLQLHRALVAAGDPLSATIDRICEATGARILAQPPANHRFKVGDTMSLDCIRKLIANRGEKAARIVMMICVKGGAAPISADLIRAVDHLVHDAKPRADAVDLAKVIKFAGDELLQQATIKRMREGGHRWRHYAALLAAQLLEVAA